MKPVGDAIRLPRRRKGEAHPTLDPLAFLQPPEGASYVAMFGFERHRLRGLPAWYVALFMLLVERADFDTGRGVTTTAALVRELTPKQPARGPRLFAPSARAVIDAMRAMQTRHVLVRDTGHSELTGRLHFIVYPRRVQSAEKAPRGRMNH